MVAFARYFPGPDALLDASTQLAEYGSDDGIRSARRSFTRLTALASWRSEYVLRTRLLRSLVRGRPAQGPSSAVSSRSGQAPISVPILMYGAGTLTIVNHLHATFGSDSNRKIPRLIHGADDVGMVTCSDPSSESVGDWGKNDPTFFSQFSERFPGVAEWGMGSGELVGRPNVMDVSQPHGMIYGQGCPEGMCYYRALDEMRGHFIAETMDFSKPEDGIPNLGVDGGAICAVWIAKTAVIPTISEGLVGLLMGSAAGVVTACSLGTDGTRGSRLQRGELTARWVLSPGVPIIAISVDDNYSNQRHAQNRVWAVALNALGEIFFLTQFPTRKEAPQDTVNSSELLEYNAWLTGRTAYWNLVEPSRRVARPDPYQDARTDGSYSPRSSWDGMCLSKDQVFAETKEIEQFLDNPPQHYRKVCLGWDMRRRLEVDFAGDDGHYAGESFVVFNCGLDDEHIASAKRFVRWRVPESGKQATVTPRSETPQLPSLFGGSTTNNNPKPPLSPPGATPPPSDVEPQPSVPTGSDQFRRTRSSSYISTGSSPERSNYVEEWRCSRLDFGGLKDLQITTSSLDHSTFAVLTMSEDPALGFSTASTATSPSASPMSIASQPASPSDIPGQRARFVAAGSKTGTILLWDIRSSIPRSSEFQNTVEPVRIIYTDSPEISCLALTALHLVHGGNDGLVQAWDVLASTTQPIKTLNSRFSSRARRRLAQAQASAQGVGINMFAAGAICLDPDPTSLRGAVSLGSQIRYWSFSSSSADQFKSSKRRLRRSEKDHHHGGDRFSAPSRATLKGYIENEKYELERDNLERARQAERLAGRFGVDLLSNEEEALAYAALLSQESLEEEKRRNASQPNGVATGKVAKTATPVPSIPEDEELDADLAEAIRLSLEDSPGAASPSPEFDIPIKFAKGAKSPSKGKNRKVAESSTRQEMSDLEFAMQLSLAEEQSRKDAASEDAFPPLSPSPNSGSSYEGKGKGRMR